MEMLGVDESAVRKMDPLQLAATLIRSFSAYVDGAQLRDLNSDPLHDPELYLKVWAQVQELGDQQCSDRSGTDTHTDCGGDQSLKRRHSDCTNDPVPKQLAPDENEVWTTMRFMHDACSCLHLPMQDCQTDETEHECWAL
jgi:hypothetical protein